MPGGFGLLLVVVSAAAGVKVDVDVGVGGVAGVNSQGRCAGDFLAESQHRLRERGSENPR